MAFSAKCNIDQGDPNNHWHITWCELECIHATDYDALAIVVALEQENFRKCTSSPGNGSGEVTENVEKS